MIGTPLIIVPRQVTCCEKSTAAPSTVKGMSPNTARLNPVAVTTMSASITAPDDSRTPVAVNSSILSVSTDAVPSRMASKKSPSGTNAMRCCHGRYAGVKCFSMSVPSGSSGVMASSRNACSWSGSSLPTAASQSSCTV